MGEADGKDVMGQVAGHHPVIMGAGLKCCDRKQRGDGNHRSLQVEA